MNNFHNIYLPDFIAVMVKGGPSFNNRIVSTIAGNEQRRNINNYGNSVYTVNNCRLNYERYQQFNSFFRARSGNLYAFKFRDLNDYVIQDNIIAHCDGVTSAFPIFKQYFDECCPFQRRIYCPDLKTLEVKLNDELVMAYQYDQAKHMVIFDSVPDEGSVISVSCNFDVVVRFDMDTLLSSEAEDGTILLENFKLLEVNI